MYNGKQRGQRRKLKNLLSNIDKFEAFTDVDIEYEHFHVPSTPWIECPKTSRKVKTAFCKKWIEKTNEFICQKPDNLTFCKVVAVISYPKLWDSQIIIFYDEKYYKDFWNRKGPYQTWIRIEDKTRSFIKTRGIKTWLPETGYKEIINEEDKIYKSYLWYYGEQL